MADASSLWERIEASGVSAASANVESVESVTLEGVKIPIAHLAGGSAIIEISSIALKGSEDPVEFIIPQDTHVRILDDITGKALGNFLLRHENLQIGTAAAPCPPSDIQSMPTTCAWMGMFTWIPREMRRQKR